MNFETWYNSVFEAPTTDAEHAAKDDLALAFEAGFEQGEDAGYMQGKETGYDHGYEAGYEAAKENYHDPFEND